MTRLLSAMRLDLTVQWRNQLYAIGTGVGLLVAVALGQLSQPHQLPWTVPTLMLLVVGGSTLLYVAGMILFEKDEGTLSATLVSPLRTTEYLAAKVFTLAGLATLEALVMIGGAMLFMGLGGKDVGLLGWPNVLLLIIGIATLGIIYVLFGVVLIVRYNSITDFLIPVSGLATLLQLPFIYFAGWVESPAFLVIPSSAPTMLMQGAFVELTAWQWIYAIGYTTLWIGALSLWAYRAFEKHIVAEG